MGGDNDAEVWARAERIAAAGRALAELDARGLVWAVGQALIRRTGADQHVDLRAAVHVALCGALGIDLGDEAAGKLDRMEAVMRGAQLHSRHADTATLLRELALRVHMALSWGDDGMADRLAVSLEAWRPPPARKRVPEISPAAVARALERRARSGRVADVAIAIGLLGRDRQAALEAVKAALKHM